MRRRHSLSGRLLGLFLLMALLLLGLVAATVSLTFQRTMQIYGRPHLVEYLNHLQRELGDPPRLESAKQLAARLPIDIYYYGADGNWGSGAALGPPASFDYHRRFHQAGAGYAIADHQRRHLLVLERDGYTLVFATPPHEGEPGDPRRLLPFVLLLLLVAGFYHAIRRLFAPIDTIKAGVARIGSGDLAHRIRVARRDELGALADSVNTMADDLQGLLEAKRQLLLAISHELRSPLTRAKLATELLDDPARAGAIGRELDEMERLVEELLETERLSTRHRALNREPVELEALARAALQGFGVELRVAGGEADLDPARLRLLLRNLAGNALRHTPAGRPPPRVTVERGPEGVAITVADSGEGIAPEHLPHLTEPFYRVDPARRRATGGYGLGLYLCRMIAQAHGGELSIESRPGEGTVVRIRLPADGPRGSPA